MTESGATVTTVNGEKIYLSVEEATNLAPYLDVLTHKREPLITK